MKHILRCLQVTLALAGLCCSNLAGAVEAAPPAASAPAYDIPRLDGVSIDGSDVDWGERDFKVSILSQTRGMIRPRSQIDGSLRLGWNDRGILALVTVTTGLVTEHDDITKLWQRDAVEMFMADAVGSRNFMQVVVAPGVDGKHALRYQPYDRREDPAMQKVPLAIEAAARKTASGYVLEALLPFKNFAIVPEIGRELAFNLQIDDYNQGVAESRLSWYPQEGSWNSSAMMMPVRLAAAPAAPVSVIANVVNERLSRRVVTVVGTDEVAGKTFTVTNRDQIIGRGQLTADQAGRSRAECVWPYAEDSGGATTLTVAVESQQPITLFAPDLSAEREEAIKDVEVVFNPAVFTSSVFPTCDVAQPALLETLLGRYSIHTTFYDAQFRPVVHASTPGRYGAVVKIVTASKTLERLVTLFRLPEELGADRPTETAALVLPTRFGLDAGVQVQQSAVMNSFLGRLLREGESNGEDQAIVFSWLFETAPGAPKAVARTDPWSSNTRWAIQLRKAIGKLERYNYVIHLPDNYNESTEKRWPLLIELHGSGAELKSFEAYQTAAQNSHQACKKDYPAIVVFPRNSDTDRTRWTPALLNLLIDELLVQHKVDSRRIYLTGFSLGAYGTWATALEAPERFAAIVPIAGAGDKGDVLRLKDMPIWVFHGTKDEAVPFARSQEMVDALKAVGSSVKFTIYQDQGHGIMGAAMGDPDFYPWLFRQALPGGG